MARKLLLKDAAAMARIINKMEIKDEMSQLVKDLKDEEKTQEDIGVNLIFMLIEGACRKDVIDDLYQFIGSILDMTGEEASELPLEDLIAKLKKVADFASWSTFFKSAVQSITTK